jgi:uncharacterized surface protein with fasciclin (FAS1) repeats
MEAAALAERHQLLDERAEILGLGQRGRDKAIDNGDGGKAALATMGGETLTATKDGANIVLTGADGSKATISKADIKASNGVIHNIDGVLAPPAGAAAGGQQPPVQ